MTRLHTAVASESRAIISLLFGVAALGIAACGGGDDESPGPGSPPAITLSIDAAQGNYPHKVRFTVGGSNPASVAWNFGDGSSQINSSPTLYHVFWEPGRYTVTATVAPAQGAPTALQVQITVADHVPQQYKALYQELNARLRTADALILSRWNGQLRPVSAAAWHLMANSHAGDKLLDPEYFALSLRYMDALKELGAKAIVVETNYPSLTSGFNPNRDGYIDYFKRLRDGAKARGLIYVAEHNSLLPGFSALSVDAYYAALKNQLPAGAGKARWGQERYAEAKLILQQIQPDYLVLIEEPTTHDSGLGVSVNEWTFHIQAVANALRSDFPSLTTKLGAGSGTWEDVRFTHAWAQMANLDFVELHMYPMAALGSDYFAEHLARLDWVQANAPGKQLLTVEGWLYKAFAAEVSSGGITGSAIFARDVYSFWAPLDQRYLELHMKLAHHYGFYATGPAWSRYLFDYLTYGDASLSGLSGSELIARANAAAGLAVIAGRHHATGDVFRDTSQGIGLAR